MKFRKKPIVIEAEQFTETPFNRPRGVCICNQMREGPHVHTLEGSLIVTYGDWIITGIQGEQYPCKPDIFEATYEKVGE